MALTQKKGDTLVLIGFTGIRLSDVVVSGASKTEIQVTKKDGAVMTFDRKTGVQTNAKDAKYANKVMDPADAPAKKEKKEAAPAKGKKTPEPAEEAPKAKGKNKPPVEEKAKSKKKPTPPPVEDDDDDDDDDEDYEEV